MKTTIKNEIKLHEINQRKKQAEVNLENALLRQLNDLRALSGLKPLKRNEVK